MKKSLFYLLGLIFFVSCSENDGIPAPPPPSSAVNMTEMCCVGNVVYGFLSQYDASWNQFITHSSYNTATGDVVSPWITDGTEVGSPYKLMSAGEYVCLSASDYVNDGDVYIFSTDGVLYDRFTAGVAPRRAVCSGDYIYVLNEGLWNANNSSLTRYSLADASVEKDCFFAANGKGIGDTANDICIYGSKMYIAVSGENVIWVTDKEARILQQIKTEGQPRYLACSGGNVYATYYDGYVARIDTTAMCVDAKVPVGRNPEQLCEHGGRLFVANSGGLGYNSELGYDRTVSVVDIATFTEIATIDVALNPANILAADNGFIYLVSLGDYGQVPNTFQRINPYNYEVTVLSE